MEGEESRNGRFTRQLNNPQCMYLLTDLSEQDTTPLGTEYVTHDIDPSDIALVPILRSGLGMIEGIIPLPHTTTYLGHPYTPPRIDSSHPNDLPCHN